MFEYIGTLLHSLSLATKEYHIRVKYYSTTPEQPARENQTKPQFNIISLDKKTRKTKHLIGSLFSRMIYEHVYKLLHLEGKLF